MNSITLAPPELKFMPAGAFVGLARRYAPEERVAIPLQWQAFNNQFATEGDRTAYGVCYNMNRQGGLDYLCARFHPGQPPAAATASTSLRVAAHRYAVFTHSGHVSEMPAFWQAIWTSGLPNTTLKALAEPAFERYGPEFSSQTGHGGYQVWIPVAP